LQTGFDPEISDWENPTYRRWVDWRYDQFGAFIGETARRIRRFLTLDYQYRVGVLNFRQAVKRPRRR